MDPLRLDEDSPKLLAMPSRTVADRLLDAQVAWLLGRLDRESLDTTIAAEKTRMAGTADG